MNLEDIPNQPTPIQRFYAGKSVFITGVTGFVGRMLMEKLLRACPDLRTIYVLIRPKDEEKIERRIKELLSDKLFDVVREKDADFDRKVVALRGDCTIPYLGLKEDVINMLCHEVSIVFHTASTVQLVEALSVATIINIFGTFEVLKMSSNMRNLQCFLYVSSAYSFCPLDLIEEKVYEGRLQPRELMSILEYDDAEEKFDRMEERVLQWCPSVIPFTKGLAENLVVEYSQCIPVAIIRPSLITSTYKEPYSNYLLDSYGPAGIISAAVSGTLKSLLCDPQGVANLVPADMCVNCMVAIPWEVSRSYKPPKCKVKDTIPVYNFESSNQPITWRQFVDKATRNGLRYPPNAAVWCYSLTLQTNRFLHYVSIVFKHFIPAIFYDTFLFVIGRKTRYWQMLMKVFFLTRAMEYITKKNTLFISRNVSNLLEKMSEDDKKIFCFDLQKLHWDEYFESYFLGIRLWALNDPVGTVKTARIKYQRFRTLDKVMTCIYMAAFVYVFYYFVGYMITPDWD